VVAKIRERIAVNKQRMHKNIRDLYRGMNKFKIMVICLPIATTLEHMEELLL
jgi:membrane protein insertase Oxa1/YidC/SpoIIIJ